MIVLLSELSKNFKQKLHIDVVCKTLTMIGLEVESVSEIKASNLNDKIIVGKINSIDKHPNADKLQLCHIETGSETLEVICGASNISKGDFVPLAKIGAILPKSEKMPEGLEIKKTKIRDINSFGMLCSSGELGFNYEFEDGILIFPEDVEVGSKVSSLTFLDDFVIDISITPNRGDCLSVYGICRELGAALNLEFSNPMKINSNDYELKTKLGELSIELKSSETLRYTMQKIENIKLGPSPFWLKNFLAKMNMSSINNVVDMSNFFMFLTGHPIHIFDADKIEGNQIIVHVGNKEEIHTLNDETKKVKDHLVISDRLGPIALAGIIGGKRASVNNETKNIYIECASFESSKIRSSSKKLNISSESSYRFERHVSEFSVKEALFCASSLIKKICSGLISKIYFDSNPDLINDRSVSLNLDKISKILGLEIPDKEIVSILNSLSINLLSDENNRTKFFSIPDYRFDLDHDHDLVEEVARLKGFESIEPELPSIPIRDKLINPVLNLRDLKLKARDSFSQDGFSEVINFSFTDDKIFEDIKKIEVLNPISKDSKYLRTSLIPSLINNALYNFNHGNSGIKLFEIGNVFCSDKGKNNQRMEIATLSSANIDNVMWDKNHFDFYDKKKNIINYLNHINVDLKNLSFDSSQDSPYKTILHPGKSGLILYNEEEIGFLGEIHPEVLSEYGIKNGLIVSTLFLDKISNINIAPKILRPFSSFPFVQRDVSVVIDKNVEGIEIVKLIEAFDSLIVRDAFIFDVFENEKIGADKKSLSISLLFGSNDRTLEDKEVTEELEKILLNVDKEIHIEVRE